MEIGFDFYIADMAKFNEADLSPSWRESYDNGAVYADYYTAEAWERAHAAPTFEAAKQFLDEGYIGCDTSGIGVYVTIIGNDTGFSRYPKPKAAR